MSPDVEVLIVSYASADHIATSLAHLAARAPDVRVAIREHSGDPIALDRLREVAATHPSPVRVSVDPSNPGFAAGCNALAADSTARWLVFLNPDATVLAWPWNDAEPPSATIVGATMIGPGAAGRHAGRRYRIADEVARSWLRRRPLPADGAGFVSGAALLVDAASFRRLGGFDSRYFLFYEDIDLCLRANQAGVRTEIAPGWQVRHAGAHSTSARFGESLQWSYESGCRFHADRGEPLSVYRAYVATDAAARALLALARRRPAERAAYRSLMRRALAELIGRRPPAR